MLGGLAPCQGFFSATQAAIETRGSRSPTSEPQQLRMQITDPQLGCLGPGMGNSLSQLSSLVHHFDELTPILVP